MHGGAVGVEMREMDDSNVNLEGIAKTDVEYRKFIHKNSEQFKSICGGEFICLV